jgi:hypothetical protein
MHDQTNFPDMLQKNFMWKITARTNKAGTTKGWIDVEYVIIHFFVLTYHNPVYILVTPDGNALTSEGKVQLECILCTLGLSIL